MQNRQLEKLVRTLHKPTHSRKSCNALNEIRKDFRWLVALQWQFRDAGLAPALPILASRV
jgi:hypothetical protein